MIWKIELFSISTTLYTRRRSLSASQLFSHINLHELNLSRWQDQEIIFKIALLND